MRTAVFMLSAWLAFPACAVAQPAVASEQHYPSDVPGSGYEWLESEQKIAWGGRCQTISEQRNLLLRNSWLFGTGQFLEKLFDSPEFKSTVFPTRCEEIITYLRMNSLAAEIGHAAETTAGRSFSKINWGTLPVFEVMATARQVGSDYMVVMNRQLFQFAANMLLNIDRTLLIEQRGANLRFSFGEEDFDKALRISPGLVSEWAYLIVGFRSVTGIGLPVLGPKRATNLEAPLVERQLRAIERFVVGHEFGHLIRGHTDRGAKLIGVQLLNGAIRRIPSLGRDWLQELQADVSGEDLASAAARGDKSASPDWEPMFSVLQEYAPALFLFMFDALEDVNLCDGSGKGSGISIPEQDQQRVEDWAFELLDAGKNLVVPDSVAGILGCRQSSHPPAWLRSRLSTRRADMKMARLGISMNDTNVLLAKAIIANARKVAVSGAEEVRRRVKRQDQP